jgi:hypothetical protein
MQKYPAIRRFYALVYRNDELQQVNQGEDRLSRAIHPASIVAGYPEDNFFQRFVSLGPSDLRVDLYYPAMPKPRTDQMLMIEVRISSGTDANRTKGPVAALGRKACRSRHRPKRHNGVLFGDRSCERIIRWRPVRTACCLRLIDDKLRFCGFIQ